MRSCVDLRWRRPGTQYSSNVWTVENGLPQNIIRGIVQAPDGYLWIATLDGLARFDGVRFTVFNKSNTPGIASNRFRSIVVGRDGDLWLDTESGGLTRYHHGEFHTYGAEDGIPTNSVRGITGDSAGNIWVLSEESIFQCEVSTGELREVTPENFRIHYNAVRWSSAGFWGQNRSVLYLFTKGHLVSYTLHDWLSGRSVSDVAVDENGTIWLEDTEGRRAVIPVGKQTAESVDTAHPQRLSYRDPHGHGWEMRVERPLKRYVDFESSGQMVSIPVGRFLEDREGNVWIGTEGKGLYRLQEQSGLRIFQGAGPDRQQYLSGISGPFGSYLGGGVANGPQPPQQRKFHQLHA